MRVKVSRHVLVPILAVAMPAAAFAQAATEPAFEVASIRPVAAGVPRAMTVTDARVDIRNYPLYELVLMAFGARPFQVTAPEWLRQASQTEARFDVQAVIPDGATREQVPDMLRALLVERFGLVTHVEGRPVPAYELVVSAAGVKMREVEPVDDLTKDFPVDPANRVRSDSTDNGVRTIAGITGVRIVTSRSLYETTLTEQGRWRLDATRMTMTELASLLDGYADRPVIDATGLTGLYQFTLVLPPLAAMARVGLKTDGNGSPIPRDPSGVSVFEAVESLGMKLEERRLPIDVVVIDRIERVPTEN